MVRRRISLLPSAMFTLRKDCQASVRCSSLVMPMAPWAWITRSRACAPIWVAKALVMATSLRAGRPASSRRAAFRHMRWAACICMADSASGKLTPWYSAMGWPKASRTLMYSKAFSRAARDCPTARAEL